MGDPINHPDHYGSNGLECIDVMDAISSSQRSHLSVVDSYCWFAAFKYIWRWRDKNGVEDLKKARWYLDRLIASMEHRTKPSFNEIRFEPDLNEWDRADLERAVELFAGQARWMAESKPGDEVPVWCLKYSPVRIKDVQDAWALFEKAR